jgi:hypothetical protein
MRQLFEFEEPSANVIVLIDVARKPKKSIPKQTPRDLPRVQALVKMIGEYIERECRDNDTAVAA